MISYVFSMIRTEYAAFPYWGGLSMISICFQYDSYWVSFSFILGRSQYNIKMFSV